MNFTKQSDYHMESDCGRFRIARALVGKAVVYSAFRVGRSACPLRVSRADIDADREAALQRCKDACEEALREADVE